MNITIKFNTDNQSFQDDYEGQVKEILENLTHSINMNNDEFEESIKDLNGNTIGKLTQSENA